MQVRDLNGESLMNVIGYALEGMQSDSGIYVAYSGGLDSQVLLQLVADYAAAKQVPLTALHVNHGLSSDADQWQVLCGERCEALGVSLQCKSVDLGGTGSANLEQRARQFRYDWFASVLKPGDVLFTGHHLDDQAETLLLRLLRASGTRGLAAIPVCRSLGAGYLIRPLLWRSKAELAVYADAAGLNWVEDESNQSLDFDRNYVRHQVIPPLLERWPGAARQLARSAAHCRDDQRLLNELAELDLSRVSTASANPVFSVCPPIALPAFLGLSVLRQRHLLQTILCRLTGHAIPGGNINEWLRQVAAYRSGGRHSLKLESIKLVLFADQMHFLTKLPDMSDASYTWLPQQSLEIKPLGLMLKLEYTTEETAPASLHTIHFKKSESLLVHWRRGGERIRLKHESHSRALKKQLQENKIAPWLRNSLPLVSYRGKIIWSAALGDMLVNLCDQQGRRLRISFSENKSNC